MVPDRRFICEKEDFTPENMLTSLHVWNRKDPMSFDTEKFNLQNEMAIRSHTLLAVMIGLLKFLHQEFLTTLNARPAASKD